MSLPNELLVTLLKMNGSTCSSGITEEVTLVATSPNEYRDDPGGNFVYVSLIEKLARIFHE